MERAFPVLLLPDPPSNERLEACFRTYSGYVAAIALRLLASPDDVDDVVQEVFLAAMAGLGNLREPHALKGWLATVTARIAGKRLRRRRWRSFLGLEKAVHFDELTRGATQEQAALVSRIYRILNELPVDQRIAWTLRHIEGEPLEQVALICGCSLSTAKRRIGAAQQSIEKAVRDE